MPRNIDSGSIHDPSRPWLLSLPDGACETELQSARSLYSFIVPWHEESRRELTQKVKC